MADLDEAVKLAPDKAEPYFSRGVGRLISGRGGAGDDFRRVSLKGWRLTKCPGPLCSTATRQTSWRAGPPRLVRYWNRPSASARMGRGRTRCSDA